MKLKKFKQLFERDGFDDIYGYDDYDYDDYSADDDNRDEDDDKDDDMSHLCYLLKSMFNTGNIDVDVDSKGLDISIVAQFSKKESLSNVVKVFEIVNKINKDILAQYSSYYELWQTKKGASYISFEFTLEGDSDSDGVFTDDDDSPW
jgi:hypothetical protein